MIKNLLQTKLPLAMTPVWFMRQAGRYLPEYMATKNLVEQKGGNFFTMCDDAEIAAEITLQPIRRFNFDAAIIFSDILIVARALNWPVEMLPEHGPKLKQITNINDLKGLYINTEMLQKTPNAIKLTKSKLPSNVDLIGFAGAPFTVAEYMMTGGKVEGNKIAKKIIYNEDIMMPLIHKIIEATKIYLDLQVQSGADVIKIFESHCSLLASNNNLLNKYHINPVKEIVDYLKSKYPSLPIVIFPRGAGSKNYGYIANNINADCIAIDENVSIKEISEIKQTKKVIQGNLDNYLLAFGAKHDIINAVEEILNNFHGYPFIFNLGHGILPETPIENVHLVLDIVRNKNLILQ